MYQQRRILDELGRALLILGAACTLLGVVVLRPVAWARYTCSLIGVAALVFCLYRMLGGRPARSYQQNLKFLTAVTAVRTFFRRLFTGRDADGTRVHRAHKARKNPTWHEIRQYKYFICPQCTQRLRVPRKKGRLRVTCTRCGNVFEIKS